ncbi:MAG TPA: tagaturonate epimerase family protein [Verrucomicrobiae bacterium]|nr:tagaturonate epimerase family protein [Verrucomicrobiae bacterium]
MQPLELGRFSLGVGDRFGRQAAAQLRACQAARAAGVQVIPVWNKSNREHLIIGSEPQSTRAAADAAVQALHWPLPYFVDADHIRIDTVDRFLPNSDFFTIDVADWIGQPADPAAIRTFLLRHPELQQELEITGIGKIASDQDQVQRSAARYLKAVQQAGVVFRHVAEMKGEANFVTEVSMDETEQPQGPTELLLILAALADEGVPVQTIAPKFSGRFNKGIDYVGNLSRFEQEFNDDLAVLAYARTRYRLPPTLKLSVHSGSDKFSLYPIMRRALARFDAGLHLKTAGTTWLEELIGLAQAGGGGLALAKEIYAQALEHVDELCAPYATVIDIDRARLPSAETVNRWSSEQFVAALRHEPRNPEFNPHLRQLLHVGYKVAAQAGQRYLDALSTYKTAVEQNVTANLYERHIKPLFVSAA